MGDNQCLLQTLKDSPYYKGFADKASLWESKLADLDEYLHNLNQIQRKWVYLEPIFGRGALPREQGRFRRVDDDFRLIMIDIAKDNRVLSLVARPGLRNVLIQLLDQLQRCQKSLNEFLEVSGPPSSFIQANIFSLEFRRKDRRFLDFILLVTTIYSRYWVKQQIPLSYNRT